MKGRTIQESIIYPGRTLTFVSQQVILPNGTYTEIEVIRHPGAAAIVPLLGESRILLIKQYRHAVEDWIWEIPAGTLSSKEGPEECAQRELAEETGYKADCLQKIGEIVPIPDYSDDLIHIFLGTELKRGTQSLEKDEILKVREVRISRAFEMIKKGEIIDAKTIIGLLLTNYLVGNIRESEGGRR